MILVSNKWFGSFIAVIFLSLLVPDQASGAIIAFTDRAAFLTAASGAGLATTNEDFATDPGDPFTVSDGSGNSVTLDIVAGLHNAFAEQILAAAGGGNPVDMTSGPTGVSGSVFGFGADVGGEEGGFGSATLTANRGGVTANQTNPDGGFVGLLSTDGMAITDVNLQTVSSEFGEAFVDNVVIASGASTGPPAVPEPASMIGMAVGSVLMGARYRRRRQTEVA